MANCVQITSDSALSWNILLETEPPADSLQVYALFPWDTGTFNP